MIPSREIKDVFEASAQDTSAMHSAIDCGMEEAFGRGFLNGPSPNEHQFRPQPRAERTHDYE